MPSMIELVGSRRAPAPVLEAVPGARLDVAGSVRAGAPVPGVAFVGEVDDLKDWYPLCSRGGLPRGRYGSGVKIKMIEALRYGKAVVATSAAVEGLPLANEPAWVEARTIDECAEATASLLSRPDDRVAVELRAQAYAARHFSPESIDRGPRCRAREQPACALAADTRGDGDAMSAAITVAAVPKAFDADIGRIQRNALGSWRRLPDVSDIILLGDEHGLAEVSDEFGAEHIGDIPCDEEGAPHLDSVFRAVDRAAATEWICYVNADIILLPDFWAAAQRAIAQFGALAQCFPTLESGGSLRLVVRRRLGRAVARCAARTEGELFTPFALDVFVYPRGVFSNMPPFSIGAFSWDNWLLHEARERGLPVADLTAAIGVIHQNHAYRDFSSADAYRRSPRALRNYWLAGDLPAWAELYVGCHTRAAARRDRAGRHQNGVVSHLRHRERQPARRVPGYLSIRATPAPTSRSLSQRRQESCASTPWLVTFRLPNKSEPPLGDARPPGTRGRPWQAATCWRFWTPTSCLPATGSKTLWQNSFRTTTTALLRARRWSGSRTVARCRSGITRH